MQGRNGQTTTRRGKHDSDAVSRDEGGSRIHGRVEADTGPFLDRLRDEIGAESYERYIGRTAGVEFDESGLHLTVPSRFAADMIDARFGPAIRRALSACGHSPGKRIRFDVAPPSGVDGAGVDRGVDRGQTRTDPPSGTVPAGRVRPRRPGGGRRAHVKAHTLESFVVGHCNRLAFETARRIAELSTPGISCPFFLYGPCGVGKTHLLSAIAGRYLEMNPGARAKLVTAESFTNEYIASVRTNTIEAFHRTYRRIDLLCIDDIHYLARKNGTQNELLHTFDTLDFCGARIVLASDAHPRQIRQFSEALISRFVSGSLVRMDSPDQATARRLVRHFAARHGLGIDEQAVCVLAESAAPQSPGAVPSARDLLGVVNRVLAYVQLTYPGKSVAVDVSLAVAAIRHGEQGDQQCPGDIPLSRPVPIDRIVDAVCALLEVTRQDLAGRGRHKGVVLARAMITLLAKRLTKRSYPEIAVAIGRKNHSTVITAHHRIDAQIERGETVSVGLHLDGTPIAILVDQLERSLRSSSS